MGRTGNKFAPARRRLNKRGEPSFFVFTDETDLPLCRTLAYGHDVREPWSYPWLPTEYFPALLQRSSYWIRDRIAQLRAEGYLTIHENRNLYTAYCYGLDEKGLKQVYERAPKHDTRLYGQFAHTLFASLTAASFELGTQQHPVTITPYSREDFEKAIPDWPIFNIATPHYKVNIALEADLDTEPLRYFKKPRESIQLKVEQYLHELGRSKDFYVLFPTTSVKRCDGILDVIREVIETNNVDKSYGLHFATQCVNFRSDITRLPKPTPWAVTEDWQRAFRKHPLNFLKASTWRE